jgi:hypothetical protein
LVHFCSVFPLIWITIALQFVGHVNNHSYHLLSSHPYLERLIYLYRETESETELLLLLEHVWSCKVLELTLTHTSDVRLLPCLLALRRKLEVARAEFVLLATQRAGLVAANPCFLRNVAVP